MTIDRILGVALLASLTACAAPPAPQPAAPVAATPAAAAPVSEEFDTIPMGKQSALVPHVFLLDPGTGQRAVRTWTARGPNRLALTISHDQAGDGAGAAFDAKASAELVVVL